MSSLTRYERFAILVLVAALLLGLGIAAYNRSHPYIKEVAIASYGIEKDNGDGAEEELSVPKININEAGIEDLRKLKGVGAGIAGRIIDYRNSNGLFTATGDIKKVKGVGKALFEKIKDRITIE